MPGVAAASSGGCLPGLPVRASEQDYGSLSGEARTFRVVLDTPIGFNIGTSTVSDLTVYILGQVFTGVKQNVSLVDSDTGVQVSWTVSGAGAFDETLVLCGNFTVDGAMYQANFSFD